MNTVKNINTVLAQCMKLEPGTFSLLKAGDLIEGRVIEKRANMIVVDLGKAGTGMVYRGEMQNARELIKKLEKGALLHARVIEVDNEDGYVELSLAEAGKQKAWGEILEIKEKGEPFPVTVVGCNKGGLTAEVAGLLAFLPVSQLAGDHYPKVEDKMDISKALQVLVGKELHVKIIDANPRTNKLIISEREAQEVSTKELVKNYTVGQVIEGIVSGVADFGAFIRFTDNPMVEGLIHVSELAHRVVENPKELLKLDQAVQAKIIDIKEGKISLSLKALQEDPWLKAGMQYAAGEEVQGTVYAINPFGAIVNLPNSLQGQLRVTEFGGIEEMKRHIGIGKEYAFIVESVEPAEKRIVLKVKPS